MKVIKEIEFYEVKDLTKILNLSRQTIEKYLKEGRIKAKKIGVKWLVSAGQLNEYLEGAENK